MGHLLLHAHSGWRYIVMLVAVVALVGYAVELARRQPWRRWHGALVRAYPVVLDIQAAMGIVLWLLMSYWRMPNPYEHLVTMLVAPGLAHVAPKRVRKAANDPAKHRQALIWLGASAPVMFLGVWRTT